MVFNLTFHRFVGSKDAVQGQLEVMRNEYEIVNLTEATREILCVHSDFILPILNALGMYWSQKMTPSPPSADPVQATMLKFMPVMFGVFFAWFPSGLVLYWLTNMFVQIIQQWWYSRTPISSK